MADSLRPGEVAPHAGAWLALVLCLCACGPDATSRPGAPRLSALLVTLDTTRADALGAYGGREGVTPALDALAAESVRYEQARTVLPFTLPAHASMLTGLYPPRHGVRDNAPEVLPAEALTLAELAADAGYQTAACVAASTLDGAWGLAQGFEVWSQPASVDALEARRPAERSAREVVADVVAWLDRRDRARPFLLWVHLFDPHRPYEPDPPFLLQGGGSPYHGEVAAMDSGVGVLLARLRQEELLDSTVVLVAGDHGEALGDHGEQTHGYFVWDSTLRVPFLVRHPDGWRAGQASAESVSVADVFPTLAEALRLELPAGLDGVSLWRREVPAGRSVYFEALGGWARFGWSPLAGVLDERGKYVHSSRPVFHRPRADPGEEVDRLDELGADVERYRAALAQVLARPSLERRQVELDAPLDAIASLGYAAGRTSLVEWPDPLAPTQRPSPLERVQECAGYLEAREMAGSGQVEAALGRLRALIAANPLHLAAMDELGAALIELGRWREAVDVLERRAALPPPRVSTHKGLLRCYLELGLQEQAIEQELLTLELLIEIALQRGDRENARALGEIYAVEAARAGR